MTAGTSRCRWHDTIRAVRAGPAGGLSMKATLFLVLPAVLLSLAGCSGGTLDTSKPKDGKSPAKAPSDPEAKIKASLAKLPKEDQAAAEAQKFCAVEQDNRLG